MDNAAIVIAIISATATIIGGSFTFWQQLKKNQQENNLGVRQLVQNMSDKIWEQANVEFDKMQSRLDEQESTIKDLTEISNKQSNTIQEQGGLIMHLRQTIQDQDNRIEALEAERDNWKSRALAAEGAKGKRL